MDPATVYARALKYINTVEFQLQGLESDAVIAHHRRSAAAAGVASAPRASGVAAGAGGGGATGADGDDEASTKRTAAVEVFNRLAAETALLDRIVNESAEGAALSQQKRDLWKKCVRECARAVVPR